MAVSISLSITQNSQSIADNTSNVTVSVIAKWTYGSFNRTEKAGSLTIDGTKYNFTSTFNTGQSTSGSQTLFSKTVIVEHNSNGTKTLSCSASFTSGVSSGTVTTSASKVLTTIPRASSLGAGNGTLGTEQTLTITRADSTFKHKITYTCGSVSGYAAGSSSAFTTSTSISWTPPLSLANQNTSGTSVSVTLYLKTYTSGGTQIGSVTKTISCAIPASVKPSCILAVTDPTGYADKYGSYVKGLSKFKVVVTPTISYGSAIASYNITANGATYTAASFTTGLLKTSGNLTVNASVKDKRGRSGSASETRSVINYSEPNISSLSVRRCNEDGTLNDRGEFAIVTFSATVTALNNQNTAQYVLRYKKTSESEFEEVGLDAYENTYSVTAQTYIFPADSGSSYNIELSVIDNHNTVTKATSASTGFTLMNFKADGTGIGIGKIAEDADTLDIALKTKPSGGFVNIPIPENTDFNNLKAPNTYMSLDKVASTYANSPIASGTFSLEVLSGGNEGQVYQRCIYTSKDNFSIYTRHFYSNAWGEWKKVYTLAGTLLASPNQYMTAGHTATLSQKVSVQPHGIVLVFSRYSSGAVDDVNFNSFFVPKYLVDQKSGYGSTFIMAGSAFGSIATKYLYIHDDQITGNADNNATGTANGITYANNTFVLRYVIGV